jgi:hypothetical protein
MNGATKGGKSAGKKKKTSKIKSNTVAKDGEPTDETVQVGALDVEATPVKSKRNRKRKGNKAEPIKVNEVAIQVEAMMLGPAEEHLGRVVASAPSDFYHGFDDHCIEHLRSNIFNPPRFLQPDAHDKLSSVASSIPFQRDSTLSTMQVGWVPNEAEEDYLESPNGDRNFKRYWNDPSLNQHSSLKQAYSHQRDDSMFVHSSNNVTENSDMYSSYGFGDTEQYHYRDTWRSPARKQMLNGNPQWYDRKLPTGELSWRRKVSPSSV